MRSIIWMFWMLAVALAQVAQGASLTVSFAPEEGQPAEYETVYLNLWPMAQGAQGSSHVSKEKEFTHTFEDLKPGRYMLMTATFKLANVIAPKPGLFRHHYQVELKDNEDQKVTIHYRSFDVSTLRGDAAVEGVIHTAEGKPVKGMKVELAAHVQNIGAILAGESTTNDQGVFRVENVADNKDQVYSVIEAESGDMLGAVQSGSREILRLGPTVGMKAPDIPFVVLGEKEDVSRKLSDFAGKVVVIDFWTTWCGPCQDPMAKMQTYAGKHPEWGDRVILLALSIDDNRSALVKHLKTKGWNKTLNAWAGEKAWESEAAKAFAVSGVPTCYILDTEGKVAHTGHPAAMKIPSLVDALLPKAE